MDEPEAGGLDPRLRVAFLLAAAIGIFLLRTPLTVSLACALLAVLWLVVKLPPRRLVRQIFKLWGFTAFVLLSYAFFANDPETDRWTLVPLFGAEVRLNTSGVMEGTLMVLRVLAIILASQIARAGDVRAIAFGLRRLGVPGSAATTIDTVFALFGDGEAGRGRRGGGGGGQGGGGGGGRGRGHGGGGRGRGRGAREDRDGLPDERGSGPFESEAPPEGFWASVRRMARGDVGPIVERLEHQIRRAERHVSDQTSGEERTGSDGRAHARDVAIVAGVSLTMLGVRALKILPSIPFAPGHKLVVLTPLYVAAGLLTRGRFGATLTGATMGTVAFLMGDGKYGIFEILKHVTPGIICDLSLPILTARGRRPGGITWSLFGGIIAAGRFATIFAMTFLIQAPAVAFAILVPGLLVHVTFGIASGWVTYHIVRTIQARAEEALRATDAAPPGAPIAPDPSVEGGLEPPKNTTRQEIAKEPA